MKAGLSICEGSKKLTANWNTSQISPSLWEARMDLNRKRSHSSLKNTRTCWRSSAILIANQTCWWVHPWIFTNNTPKSQNQWKQKSRDYAKVTRMKRNRNETKWTPLNSSQSNRNSKKSSLSFQLRGRQTTKESFKKSTQDRWCEKTAIHKEFLPHWRGRKEEDR